jgi:hypothetical protein
VWLRQWEFIGVCPTHPCKAPDRHCPLLPGVISNPSGAVCGGCQKVEPTLLRGGCGHFVCAPKCWRNYARAKLDNRELLFNTPSLGADATLACPGILPLPHCRAPPSHAHRLCELRWFWQRDVGISCNRTTYSRHWAKRDTSSIRRSEWSIWWGVLSRPSHAADASL